MKKILCIPFVVSACLGAMPVLAAETIDIAKAEGYQLVIEIEGETVKEVSVTEVKSADLAEALSTKIPGISMVRRSGIANDIILRGQKKDNINVLIDNAKVYGACPNRMDPPTSHILNNNIDQIEIIEGPYDVENFGTLSGAVRITTKMPEPGFHGDVSLNLGSWEYEKIAATLGGGGEKLRAIFSVSEETSGQYEDGDGNDFSEQIEAFVPGSPANYKPEYKDIDAYQKRTFMGKLYAEPADNQVLELSYTANRSDDVLYPSSKMDALYDDSDIINFDYRFLSLGQYSSMLNIQLYDSRVEHPMSTFYRQSSGPNSANERISELETHTQGAKLINEMDLSNSTELRVGLDFSNRNWDGSYEGFGTSVGITGIESIPDVDTKNQALFVETNRYLDDWKLKFGARYDDTSIEPGSGSLESNDYSAFSAFVFGKYRLDEGKKLFAGLGRASRVPDARELYFRSAMGPGGMLLGNPELEQTTNTEIDVGLENKSANLSLKTRLFYSWLDDYIHYNDSKTMRRFDNVDATIYGIDFSGNYVITTSLNMDFGLAYQRGEKDEALPGQTDTDLAEIPPMKGILALNYIYREQGVATLELVAADSWSDFDADNGEQKLDSWSVVNFKIKHLFDDRFNLTAGVDNVFDETYAVSNTYKDLTLLIDGSGDIMLMNEPGRYVYLNAVYSF